MHSYKLTCMYFICMSLFIVCTILYAGNVFVGKGVQ